MKLVTAMRRFQFEQTFRVHFEVLIEIVFQKIWKVIGLLATKSVELLKLVLK